MNNEKTIKNVLQEQYKSAANLNARINLHRLFSTNPKGWYPWYLEQLDLPENCRILELGCGPGAIWKASMPTVGTGWRLTLTDYSPGMVQEAFQINDPQDRFTFSAVDAQSIPFPDETFDAVLANHMLYHVPDKVRALSEIRRVLRPGGKLYAATNGTNNMTELFALEDQFIKRIANSETLPPRQMWALSFSLENGGDLLRQHFGSVELHRYQDSLRVTEAQPLVDYILSMINHFTREVDQPVLGDFTRQLDEEIQRNGAIHITKDGGMFIAVK